MKKFFLVASLLCSSVLFGEPVHNIVMFGDSLSDDGNLYEFVNHTFPAPPYVLGRFSNGPVWSEYLANFHFGKKLCGHFFNYALGGAKVKTDTLPVSPEESPLNTLDGQVNAYFTEQPDRTHAQDSLFIVWIGSNNYLEQPNDVDDPSLPKSVTASITKSLKLLADKGAKHILVINLPDIGRTPFGALMDEHLCGNDEKQCVSKKLTKYSKAHNVLMQAEKKELTTAYPNVQWIYFDLEKKFEEVMDNPTRFNLSNVTSACNDPGEDDSGNTKTLLQKVTRLKPRAVTQTCEQYLFYDVLHPTTSAAQIIALEIDAALKEAGIDISS